MVDDGLVANSAPCTRCQGILRLEDVRWTDDHPVESKYRIRMRWQPSISQLRDSAKNGCELCLNVCEELSSKGTSSEIKEQQSLVQGRDSEIIAEIIATHSPDLHSLTWSMHVILLTGGWTAVIVGFHHFRVSRSHDRNEQCCPDTAAPTCTHQHEGQHAK